MSDSRLKIAIQKSGRLSDATLDLLKKCGLNLNKPKDRLIMHVKNMPIDLLFVRDDDIPGLVMDGVVDIGFAGDNIVQEVKLKRQTRGEVAEFNLLKQLDYGNCRLSIAFPEEKQYESISDLGGKTLATTYPYLTGAYLKGQGVKAKTVQLKGSVEVAPRAGLSDAICDIVSTGTTLEANGLKEVATIFRSSAVAIQKPDLLSQDIQKLVDRLMVRINGVMQAKESKYIMLHAPKTQLDTIVDLLPGAEKPTILPLAGSEDMVAIHAVATETVFWETMERIKALGGSSILVLPIEKMLG
ncbi:MAG: ATP phosphoribosyltransferase [Candidatus Marinimicrobia bacterium]|nr:ATP phosphoribosyltransferase [Candidatus Neomarinimicrobiota bacterium]MCF7850737.1 ATP phosphoribosyltransferase [Candidatus Neomarinimicrobiota bacterium]